MRHKDRAHSFLLWGTSIALAGLVLQGYIGWHQAQAAPARDTGRSLIALREAYYAKLKTIETESILKRYRSIGATGPSAVLGAFNQLKPVFTGKEHWAAIAVVPVDNQAVELNLMVDALSFENPMPGGVASLADPQGLGITLSTFYKGKPEPEGAGGSLGELYVEGSRYVVIHEIKHEKLGKRYTHLAAELPGAKGGPARLELLESETRVWKPVPGFAWKSISNDTADSVRDALLKGSTQ